MPDPLHAKLNDFAQYAIKALEQHRAGEHADALGNMRKAGEAACKVLLFHALNRRQAEALIEGGNLQQLIGSVQRLAGPPSEVVNHLKALQIQGNKGVHDGPVVRGSATIGAVHLTALAEWLLVEHMGIAVPPGLAAALSGKAVKEALDAERRKQEEEQRALTDHIAGLQARLDEIAAAEARKSSEREALEKELAAIREQAGEQQALREELARLKSAVEEQGARATAVVAAVAPEPAPQRARRTWWWIAAVVAGLAIGVMVLWRTGDADPVAENWAAPADTVLRVVLVPFTVVQDDPQLHLRFEEVLRAKLQEHAAALHLAVDLRTLDSMPPRSLSTAEALAFADSLHAGLLFHGELAEPTSTDSGAVTLRYVMKRQKDNEVDFYRPIAFRTLREKATEVLVATTGNLMDRAMANLHARRGRWSQALALLYASQPTSDRADRLMTMFRVQCHMELGQYQDALRESLHLNGMAPDDALPYMLAAKALRALGRYHEAAGAYDMAVARRPNDPKLLLDHADMLVAIGGADARAFTRSEALVRRALELDSTDARGWFYLGQAAYAAQRWSEARLHLEHAIALGFPDAPARVNLAEILLLHVKDPDAPKAEHLLLEVFAADSTEPKVLYLLGELYSKSERRDAAKAKLFYERASRRTPQAERENKLGLATVALQQGRPEQAVELLAPLWAKDSTHRDLGNTLAQAYLETGRHREALAVGRVLLNLDPLNQQAHYNMAYIHRFGNADVRDLPRAAHHFREALKTDPQDTLVLEYLGNTLVDMHDPVNAEPYLRRGLALAPDSYGLNRGMALVIDQTGRSLDAVPYYERAVRARPDDDLMLSNLAYLCLAEGPQKDIGKALMLAEQSVRLKPIPANRVVLAMALLSHKRNAEAAQVYRAAVAESPEVANQAVEEELPRRGY